jgi:hypothetical protein
MIRTSDATDAVNDAVDHLLANGVVATSIVVGSILLAADQELRVEQLSVRASSDLIDWRGIQVNEDGARHVFSVARLSEEGLRGAALSKGLRSRFRVGTSIGQQAMLE